MVAQLVNQFVDQYVAEDKMFTSVDIANEIKKSGQWVSNGDIAYALRLLDVSSITYTNTIIDVCKGTVKARLYHKMGADISEYTEDQRNQRAITYHEFLQIKSGVLNIPSTATTSSPTTAAASSSNAGGPVNMKKIKVTNGKVQIPAKFVEMLGLYPGDDVDMYQFKYNGNILHELDGKVVHKDGRVVVRDIIPDRISHVEITCGNGEIEITH